ncbi:hypothetical protein [Geomonas propionica]|uniref:Integrase n=1 Tax=Geomonas propionica TaxID=2798582 RepID=A0ABS0YSG2_9BACT|nr:hypothetical protein [Geomonas propionica]MBJ6800435.1 hypothetical protein [Geomonas propionica]
MSPVLPFTPCQGIKAQREVELFIEYCKNRLDLYGSDLDWNSVRWEVASQHRRKGHYGKRLGMVFSSLGSARHRAIPMHPEYVDFAKAYLRHEMTFSGEKNFTGTLSGARILEAALADCSRDGVPRVYLTDEVVAARAVEIIDEHYSSVASRYQFGWRLEKIIAFLVAKGLVSKPFDWKSPLPPPQIGTLLGEEHDRRRAEKLPSREVLEALGAIFDMAEEPRDQVITAALALLSAAPGRISEAVTIPNDCEVWLPNDDGTKDLALRWYPAKGGPKGLKHLVKVMEPVVVKALERARRYTELGRTLARWYEEHPNQLFLPPDVEHLRQKELLTGDELARIFGWRDGYNAPRQAKHYGLTIFKSTVLIPNRRRKDGSRSQSHKEINLYSFAEVEKKIISMLPPGFPWLDRENQIRYSEALFVVPKAFFDGSHGFMPTMFMALDISAIGTQLGGERPDNNIFLRFGFRNPDGSVMRMTTRQLRHWLNTICQRGGLSDLERDIWSGRVVGAGRKGGSVNRQGLAYLHNTTEEIMDAVGMTSQETDLGPSLASSFERLPITREEFMALENKPPVHVTEFGICFHDFALLPCSLHADCLNCMEHACIKGEPEKTARIRQCHQIVQEQLRLAQEAVGEGYLKAEHWYEHQALTAKRLTGLLELLDDETLPVGSLIMLTNPFQYSAFRNAVTDRATLLGEAETLALADALTPKLSALPGGEIKSGC